MMYRILTFLSYGYTSAFYSKFYRLVSKYILLDSLDGFREHLNSSVEYSFKQYSLMCFGFRTFHIQSRLQSSPSGFIHSKAFYFMAGRLSESDTFLMGACLTHHHEKREEYRIFSLIHSLYSFIHSLYIFNGSAWTHRTALYALVKPMLEMRLEKEARGKCTVQ